MYTSIVCGSHRKNSSSLKVANYIESYLKEQDTETFLLDLGEHPLELWDETVWSGDKKWEKQWGPIEKHFEKSDAFVLISPEYAGMASPALKNLFLFCGSTLRHKPGLLVGVSASRNGAYPIAELRMSSYKNSHLIYIPEHVIVRDVENFGKNKHGYVEQRMNYSLNLLPKYAEAFSKIRKSNILKPDMYTFGM